MAGVEAAFLVGLTRGVADALLRLLSVALVGDIRTETGISWVTGRVWRVVEVMVVCGQDGSHQAGRQACRRQGGGREKREFIIDERVIGMEG